ncbi:serine hydrolase [Aureisphaera galaxeae]|uniref:serine hydrolase n=1 Tax=Aureisphaera galaxeae TaxID=1538023 RepID=UPI002350BC87|nr:serine hydrolase [Aureisphaera galaxeae]MDC8004345.1 serine hydrolase [Aureisphaera galaxeae]
MRLVALFVFLFSSGILYAQQSSPAIAYPTTDIVVDGNLNDWPKNATSYKLTYVFDDPNRPADDFAPSFRVAYDSKGKHLFVGVEVIDDDHLSVAVGEEGNRDTVTLYVDLQHDTKGGANVLFTAGDEGYTDIFKRSPDFDGVHADFDWEDVTVAVKRMGKVTTYEWQIALGDDLRPMHPIGIDFFISDRDMGEEEAALAIWTPQFGKSLGAIRLGEVLPVSEDTDLDWVEGRVTAADTLVGPIERIKFVNKRHPERWFQTAVDSTGYYKTILPEGTYTVSPTYDLNLDLFSGSHGHETRRITPIAEVKVQVGKTEKAPDLVLKTIAKPKFETLSEGALRAKKPDLKEIDRFIKEHQDYYGIPGVSIALIKDGEVVYNLNRGVKHRITGEKLTNESLYEGASTTKTLFAVMVLRLVERGIIDLDKPLLEYLPFPLIEKDERSKLITARIVLNHQSGLSNWPYPSKFGGPGGWMNGPDITLNFEPGSEFGYSGAAYNYLGRVVAHLTGKSVSQVFKEEVAIPFGLKNTHFTYDRSILDQLATGHYHAFPSYKERTDVDSPASSVMTEAMDFSNFVIGLMKEEHMSQATYESIYTPYTKLTSEQRMYDPEYPQGVANGFFVQETPDGKIIGHGGNNGDFNCKYAYILGEQVGYVAFANNNLGEDFVRDLELFLFRGTTEE